MIYFWVIWVNEVCSRSWGGSPAAGVMALGEAAAFRVRPAAERSWSFVFNLGLNVTHHQPHASSQPLLTPPPLHSQPHVTTITPSAGVFELLCRGSAVPEKCRGGECVFPCLCALVHSQLCEASRLFAGCANVIIEYSKFKLQQFHWLTHMCIGAHRHKHHTACLSQNNYTAPSHRSTVWALLNSVKSGGDQSLLF